MRKFPSLTFKCFLGAIKRITSQAGSENDKTKLSYLEELIPYKSQLKSQVLGGMLKTRSDGNSEIINSAREWLESEIMFPSKVV